MDILFWMDKLKTMKKIISGLTICEDNFKNLRQKNMDIHLFRNESNEITAWRGSKVLICPYKQKACGNLCPLFEIISRKDEERVNLCLHCAPGDAEYSSLKILGYNEI